MKKQYQNIGAQIVNLEKNKNVDKTTVSFPCFGEKTYLDLITPYSDLIALGRDENGKHIYPPQVDFAEYIEYNQIDYAICNRLQLLIGAFEKMMKNFLMHKFCEKMKNDGDKQVKDFSWTNRYVRGSQIFDLLKIDEVFEGGMIKTADSNVIGRRKGVLKTIREMGKSPSKNNIVEHYKNKYHYVPMFVAVHSLTLGQLLTLYGMLSQSDKNELLCIFNGTSLTKRYSDAAIEKFEKDALRVQVIRNIINHYEPIFPFIQNTEYLTFASLTALLEKLKNYYNRCVSYLPSSFNVTKTFMSRNSYSYEFHIKIEKVLKSLV